MSFEIRGNSVSPVWGELKFMRGDDFIVSHTDTKGIITYANRLFIDFSEYKEGELLGKPHNIIRHPGMPRAPFSLLWEVIKEKGEVFAFVYNRSKNGRAYPVMAHVTPIFAENGVSVIGYKSVRREPRRDVLAEIIDPLYRDLCSAERKFSKTTDQAAAGRQRLNEILLSRGVTYEQFILPLL